MKEVKIKNYFEGQRFQEFWTAVRYFKIIFWPGTLGFIDSLVLMIHWFDSFFRMFYQYISHNELF